MTKRFYPRHTKSWSKEDICEQVWNTCCDDEDISVEYLQNASLLSDETAQKFVDEYYKLTQEGCSESAFADNYIELLENVAVAMKEIFIEQQIFVDK